ncbi:MAG: OsmC family protein [Candidatus Eisenbacteria bacterium]|nr:OsmC family protein [Candidatus Eisenbacteria bacterium]
MALTQISLTQENGVVCQIFTKAHIVTADDPIDPKGEDEGPTPLEYLLAALGSSAAIALRRAGERLGLPIEEVQASVKLRTTLVALTGGEDPVAAGPIQREIRVRISRDISETERDELLAAAKSSPVDRILASLARVEDALYILGYAAPDEGVIVE